MEFHGIREENRIIEELYLSLQLVLLLVLLNMGFPILSDHYSLAMRYFSIVFGVFLVIKLGYYAVYSSKRIPIGFSILDGLFVIGLVALSENTKWNLTDIFYLYVVIQQMRYQEHKGILFPLYTAFLHTLSNVHLYGTNGINRELLISISIYFLLSWLISFVYKHINALYRERDYYYLEITKKNDELSKLATTDYLTELANHQAFYHFYNQLIQNANNTKHPFGLVLIDIDNFKMINDTYGHVEGDFVLKTIAKLIEREVRRSDMVARYGGEEFAILLPNTHMDETSIMAERIRERIEHAPFNIKSTLVHITVSIGASTFIVGDVLRYCPVEFVENVDELLYEAKRTGKNKVICRGQREKNTQ